MIQKMCYSKMPRYVKKKTVYIYVILGFWLDKYIYSNIYIYYIKNIFI